MYRTANARRVLQKHTQWRTFSAGKDGAWLAVGSARVRVHQPERPELVPRLYADKVPHCQSPLRHIQWMAQKDVLGQDMFLVGPPGPLRRHLALAYCELTGREMEYVSLSRDTTETDLKQRREIVAGTVHYVDQPAVRAALEGRVLVLEGMEKAERNVLPVLNNLLENREMQLDDGRLIVAPLRYDQLYQDYGSSAIRKWNLVRASDRFHVVGIGLPVPPYRSIYPIHPGFRVVAVGEHLKSSGSSSQASWITPELLTMFQFHHVPPLPIDQEREVLMSRVPKLPNTTMDSLLTITQSLRMSTETLQQLVRISRRLAEHPSESLHHMIHKASLSRCSHCNFRHWWWVPIIAPMVGAAVAAVSYLLLIDAHHPLSGEREVEQDRRSVNTPYIAGESIKTSRRT